MRPLPITAELRRQHQTFLRSGYDGHNRHSGITTMARLSGRRRRRSVHRALRQLALGYTRASLALVDSVLAEDYRSRVKVAGRTASDQRAA